MTETRIEAAENRRWTHFANSDEPRKVLRDEHTELRELKNTQMIDLLLNVAPFQH